ncbi:sodium-coupled neutral amino acid transporter 7-like [Physella acuta]|uniref:sodium-coupled neutral amino acid transporter 7-like n=1 Tax=Physella acuta TaxID=109671 RepID=UPI0027DE71DA|nr:sodium-coupled neutral amino acid transporter 7-like [Physella acuta]
MVRKSAKEDKRQFIQEMIAEAETAAQQGKMKRLYEVTRAKSGKNINPNKPVKDKVGNILTSDTEQRDRWILKQTGGSLRSTMGVQVNNGKWESSVDVKEELKSIADSSSLTNKNLGSGWFVLAFLLFNSTVGGALLNLPISYHHAGGVFIGIFLQLVVPVFILPSLYTLIHCSDIKGSNTYQDVVLAICGPKAQLACAICVLMTAFCTCISFLVIIGDIWELVFLNIARDTYCTTNPFYMTRTFMISVTSIAFILPMCFPKRIDFLRYTSIIGVVGVFYIVGLVAIKYVQAHDNQGKIAIRPHSWMDVILVVPDICFAYQCQIALVPIYSCMAKRNMREFSKTVTLSMVLFVVTYTVTASLGYLQFGENVTNDILLSFNPTTDVMVAVVLFAVKTYTTYPINCFCGKAAFDTVWGVLWKMSPEEILYREKMRRVITTLVWFTLTLILSIFIPNIGVVMEILGAFAGAFIFIFPGLCLLKTVQERLESGEKQAILVHVLRGVAIIFIAVGVFIFGITLSKVIMKDVKGVKPDSSKFMCRNIALKQETQHASTMRNYESDKAVDGNRNADMMQGSYAERQRLKGFLLEAFSSDQRLPVYHFNDQSGENNVPIYDWTTRSFTADNLTITSGISDGSLTLCEVEIYGGIIVLLT